MAKGLTQDDVIVASRAYSDTRTIRAIEAHTFIPSRSRLIRLLRYGLEVDDKSTINEFLSLAEYSSLSKQEIAVLGL
jgi:hypothetical protein